jgi:peroxiredoxin (alkyl hydroperoxide reductase subunit C)
MKKHGRHFLFVLLTGMSLLLFIYAPASQAAFGLSDASKNNIYNPGLLKPTDSVLKLKAGDSAPNFTLKAVSGETVSLRQYRGKKNVVISFVPAAWTPVCSDQWPGCNILTSTV